jgi:hypothetical protein
LAIVPDGTHAVAKEQPARVAALIRRHLTDAAGA